MHKIKTMRRDMLYVDQLAAFFYVLPPVKHCHFFINMPNEFPQDGSRV